MTSRFFFPFPQTYLQHHRSVRDEFNVFTNGSRFEHLIHQFSLSFPQSFIHYLKTLTQPAADRKATTLFSLLLSPHLMHASSETGDLSVVGQRNNKK